MPEIREVIVVEGRYDKNALRQVVDAVILETSGFGVFNDRQKQKLLRSLAEKRGLIVLTDSDGAGFVIRNFIRSCVDAAMVKHAYIPDVYGKEPQILLEALRRAGASFVGENGETVKTEPITKTDLYRAGLSGGDGSREARLTLLRALDLPEHLTANALLEVLNAMMGREDFFRLIESTLPRTEER